MARSRGRRGVALEYLADYGGLVLDDLKPSVDLVIARIRLF